MSAKNNKFLHAAIAVFVLVSVLFSSMIPSFEAQAAPSLGFVILNSYSKVMNIGEECYLAAITSTGKKPSFSSNNSKVASVNTYGKITAKKAGTARITAKLSATASTGRPVTFRSNKKSVATVDSNGVITAKKPGTATILASADGTTESCIVTVKKPQLYLSKSSVTLYRNRKFRLTVKSTSKSIPKWKSNKKSVATVDDNGNVTTIKNGTATITVTVDGVSKTCEVIVKKPTVTFEKSEITLAVGAKKHIRALVSSGNQPVYSSSNTCIASVDENGTVFAHDAGKAYIYASEDGVKSRMRVIVTQK